MQPPFALITPSANSANAALPIDGSAPQLDQIVPSSEQPASFAKVLADSTLSQKETALAALADQTTPDVSADGEQPPQDGEPHSSALPQEAPTEGDVPEDPYDTKASAQTTSQNIADLPGQAEPSPVPVTGTAGQGNDVWGNLASEQSGVHQGQPTAATSHMALSMGEMKTALGDTPSPIRPESADLWQTAVLPNAVSRGSSKSAATIQHLGGLNAAKVSQPLIATAIGPIEDAVTNVRGPSEVTPGNASPGELPLSPKIAVATPLRATGAQDSTAPQRDVSLHNDATRAALPIGGVARASPAEQLPASGQLNATAPPQRVLRDAHLRRDGNTPEPRRVDGFSINAKQNPFAVTKQVAPLTPWQGNAMQLSEQAAAKELLSIDPITGETRLTTATTGTTATAAHARPEMPVHIARQLAEVIQQQPKGTTEINLKPQELGAVRMTLQQAESGIVVSLVAERPETLDLMRRNIDQLGAEFQELGYTNIAFSFAGADTDPDSQSQSEGGAGFAAADSEELSDPSATTIHLAQGTTGGVDLRL